MVLRPATLLETLSGTLLNQELWWEIVFETLVHSLPHVDLTEISYFLASPRLLSLSLDSVSGEWLDPVCLVPLESGIFAPCTPLQSPALINQYNI